MKKSFLSLLILIFATLVSSYAFGGSKLSQNGFHKVEELRNTKVYYHRNGDKIVFRKFYTDETIRPSKIRKKDRKKILELSRNFFQYIYKVNSWKAKKYKVIKAKGGHEVELISGHYKTNKKRKVYFKERLFHVNKNNYQITYFSSKPIKKVDHLLRQLGPSHLLPKRSTASTEAKGICSDCGISAMSQIPKDKNIKDLKSISGEVKKKDNCAQVPKTHKDPFLTRIGAIDKDSESPVASEPTTFGL